MKQTSRHRIVFTICSNNYLAKARVLLSSITSHDDTEVYLILADSANDTIKYDSFGFNKVIYPEELNIVNLQWMKEHYSVVEFNTALKSFAFEYIFNNTLAEIVYYFDPDIQVYQPIESLGQYWAGKSIVLTPHVLTPLPFDGQFPGENLFANHGTFNLGFLGLRRSEVTNQFLRWWSERLTTHCVIDLKEGYFVDQIWFNLVPIYFPADTAICFHPGWNMAFWNLHERKYNHANDWHQVNNQPLFFYHFSSFDFNLTTLGPQGYPLRYSFSNYPEIFSLYKKYKDELELFDFLSYKSYIYFEGKYPLKVPSTPLVHRISRRVKKEFRQFINR